MFRRARESEGVQAVLKGFPRAEILEVRDLRAETAAPYDEQPGFDADSLDDLAD